MKKRNSSRFSLLLVCLLVLLVAGQGLASGFVLCIGGDGHPAYEQAFAGKCTPVQPSCPAAEVCSCASCADDSCGPCQDISAFSDSLHGRSRGDQDLSTQLPLPAMSTVPSPAFTSFIRELTANLFPLPPPQPYTALSSLRTVILLN
jgi:hypothetical protein